MKFLITGKNGQVGGALAKTLAAKGIEFIALSRAEINITDAAAVDRAVSLYKPTHVINAAAYNDVDSAEDHRDAAFDVNARGPANLALAARKLNAVIVHYSTDYVFDGKKKTDYTEDDVPNPLSVYAESKLAGERGVLKISDKSYIIRSAWIFAPGGNNFVSRLLKRAESRGELEYADDIWGTPTYAQDLAEATLKLLLQNAPFGLYHAAGSEACTPLTWAKKAAEAAGLNVKLKAISQASLAAKAARPIRSVMANTKLAALGIVMPGGLARTKEYFNRMSS